MTQCNAVNHFILIVCRMLNKDEMIHCVTVSVSFAGKRPLSVRNPSASITIINSVSCLQNLGNSEFRVMKDKILTLIHEDARFVKGCISLSMQRCFAIKADINELLDVARQIYCELISDMRSKRIIIIYLN